MARFVGGDIVVVPFPMSSTPALKRRPALVLAAIPFGTQSDYILCMITSQSTNDLSSVEIEPSDVIEGSLALRSYVRPCYVFTASENAILYRFGKLASNKLSDSVTALTLALGRPR